MPRNVRNFWIVADIDGRREQLEGGPQRADGGFTLRILQRDKGDIVTAMEISGRVTREGKIVLEAELPSGSAPMVFETVR